jgi:hypothetical protein
VCLMRIPDVDIPPPTRIARGLPMPWAPEPTDDLRRRIRLGGVGLDRAIGTVNLAGTWFRNRRT